MNLEYSNKGNSFNDQLQPESSNHQMLKKICTENAKQNFLPFAVKGIYLYHVNIMINE